jgi:hypothetical protein
MSLIKFSSLDESLPEIIRLFGKVFVLNKENFPAFGCYYSAHSNVTIQVFTSYISVKLHLEVKSVLITEIEIESPKPVQTTISDNETYLLNRINEIKQEFKKSYNDIDNEFGKLLILL